MCRKQTIGLLFGLLLGMCCTLGWAAPPPGSLGAISDELMVPAAGIAKMLFYISFICGAGFFLGALIQYKYYRENPQQVRLSTPITLLILSIVLIGFPLVLIFSGTAPWIGY
jgi:hypothetical protein